VFAVAVPPGFYSAVARLAALFPDAPAEKASTRATKPIKRAAPSIPTKKFRVAAKKALAKKTTSKKAAQSIKMSRGRL